jgi:sulfur carrier protein
LEIVINGEPRKFDDGAMSVADLLAALESTGPQVAVEVNEQLVARTQHADHQLTAGDRVEIVTLVGGG